MPMTASSVQIDPEAAGVALLRQADQLRCATLVETAVFADEQDTLVLRLRVYPLLPTLGDGGSIVGLRIGAPLFVTQRDLDLKALLRLKPDMVGQQMAAEYLQHDPALIDGQAGKRGCAQRDGHEAGPVHPLPAARRDQRT